jgi:glutamate-ammonia-ligase adenylyltransferase
VERENFVADVQAMRRRVEAHVPAREAERQLKLGRGGLRDVEFSIQLLQLVHGRTDERLRTGNTLDGIEQLSTFGFIGRDAAAALDRAYRNLRVLEHRLQLARLRRTHVLPTGAAEQRRLARSARLGDVTGLEELWRSTRAIVRPLHESLFYRPILADAARLTADEARLTPQAAQDRLKALGYMNPAGAMKHLEALTDGVSRRAAIQRQLLPVLLGWFADGADPDRGLLAFRKVSDALGTTHWYLQMLRDSGAAAERMAHVLSSGQFAGDLMVRLPESTRWLDDVDLLMPRSLPDLRVQAAATLSRHESLDTGLEAVRLLRTREVLRTAIADIADVIEVEAVGAALSWATEAALDAALTACIDHVAAVQGIEAPTRIAIIAMGRLGGAELSYGSDADVMFVHDPYQGHDPRLAHDFAHLVCATLQKGLRVPSAQLPVVIDPTLRPEGRDGPLVRTLDSYARYYERWSAGWESQALLRADPVGGDEQLGRRFVELIEPLRYPKAGLSVADVREIRRIKARVESERLPRGVAPKEHLKLGPGGIADVEWTAQLLQLQHAAELEGLRTTTTLGALRAAGEAGLLGGEDRAVLEQAWLTTSRVRNAITLWRGRSGDVIPSPGTDLQGVAHLLGFEGHGEELRETIRRRMRMARTVVDRVFFGEAPTR